MSANQTNGTPAAGPTLLSLAVQRLERIRNEKLAEDVKEKAIHCLIDYFGALVTGLSAPWSPAILKYALSSGGKGECFVAGTQSTASAEMAAFANGSIAHRYVFQLEKAQSDHPSVIRDDMHLKACSHVGVLVIPAALALAQRDNWTGSQLLKAIVGGYEMAAALGESVNHSGLANPHVRPSGIIGAFGAAGAGITADASIDSATAASALSLGSNFAAGLNEWAWAGGTEIFVQMGLAGRNGISSLELAKAGIYSSDTALEGKDGVFEAYRSGSPGIEKFRKLMTEFDPGTGIMAVRFKPVAGCNFIQTPLSVAVRLADKVKGQTGQIRSIRVVVTTSAKNYPGCNNYGPLENIQQTKMSIQYGVSAALFVGRVDEQTFRQFGNEEIKALVPKCSVETSEDFDRDFTKGHQPCRIKIVMEDGTSHEDELKDVPWLDGPSVEERFKREGIDLYSSDVVNQLIASCHRLGDEEASTKLFKLLSSTKSNLSGM